MCTYNLMLDDQLVAEATNTLTKGTAFQLWLQQQVEEMLREQVRAAGNRSQQDSKVFRVKRSSDNVPTDEQLEVLFADKEMPAIPDDSPWNVIINANTGKVIKPMEKWL